MFSLVVLTSKYHADDAWKRGYDGRVNSPAVRAELVATLEEALLLQQRLVTDARDAGVPVPDLVAQVSVLERLDDRRDELIGELRRTASAGIRATRPGPSIREVVLATLAELRWPQNAGFLEGYLWATRQLQLDSRAFAPLRRDEQRAWQRAPGARDAYIAPALNADGSPNPRWITSSGWELGRRVVASAETERLFDLQKILALAGRPPAAAVHDARPRRPTDAMLERYAEQVLGIEPPPASDGPDEASAWRDLVRTRASELIGEIRGHDEPRRKQIAARLASLPERDRIWGRGPSSLAREAEEQATAPA
jgi:hypothetical protein